jgi:hypothetical protein
MNERREQPTGGFHLWLALAAAIAAALAVSAGLFGCGNVADVGVGASQGAVQPVSGAYGYGGSTSAYTSTQLQDQERKVDAVARENAKPDSKAAAATLKAVKAQPDAEADTVPDVTPEVTPAVDPELMSAIVSQEQGSPPAVTGVPPPGGPGG